MHLCISNYQRFCSYSIWYETSRLVRTNRLMWTYFYVCIHKLLINWDWRLVFISAIGEWVEPDVGNNKSLCVQSGRGDRSRLSSKGSKEGGYLKYLFLPRWSKKLLIKWWDAWLASKTGALKSQPGQWDAGLEVRRRKKWKHKIQGIAWIKRRYLCTWTYKLSRDREDSKELGRF